MLGCLSTERYCKICRHSLLTQARQQSIEDISYLVLSSDHRSKLLGFCPVQLEYSLVRLRTSTFTCYNERMKWHLCKTCMLASIYIAPFTR